MTTYDTLLIEKLEGYALVTINRPDVLNAVNKKLVDEMHQALDVLAADEAVRGLVFQGAGEKAFIAGADISELVTRTVTDALAGINARLFQKVEDFPWPTIAAIRGFALGGGCEFALACDVRIGGESTKMGQPEVNLGILPGAGAPHRLTRTVGPGIARELIFTGRIIDAAEAHRIGLLNHVYPDADVPAKAREMMQQMLKMSPMAVRLSKMAMNAAVNTVDRRSSMVEMLAQGICFETADKKERMTKFLERKKAKG
jgi:enoyl-CoA hydratase